MLTHRNLLTMTLAYLADLRDVRPGDGVLHAAPLTHGGGLYALAAAGSRRRQVSRPRAASSRSRCSHDRRRGVTDIAFLTPTMVKWLTEAQDARGATSRR